MMISAAHSPFTPSLSAYRYGLDAPPATAQAPRPAPPAVNTRPRADTTLEGVYPPPGPRGLKQVREILNSFAKREVAQTDMAQQARARDVVGDDYNPKDTGYQPLYEAGEQDLARYMSDMQMLKLHLGLASKTLTPIWSLASVTEANRDWTDAQVIDDQLKTLANTQFQSITRAMDTMRQGALSDSMGKVSLGEGLEGAALNASAKSQWQERLQQLAPLSEDEQNNLREALISGYRARVASGELTLTVATRRLSSHQSQGGAASNGAPPQMRVIHYQTSTSIGGNAQSAEAFFDRFFAGSNQATNADSANLVTGDAEHSFALHANGAP